MQEERKSCCRIKHLNPFKSIFLLWIGTFAARGMYVRVGTIESNFLSSRKLQFTSKKSLLCKNGHKFCSTTYINSFQSLTMRPLKHLTFKHEYMKRKNMTSKRVRPHFVGLSTMYGRWMDESQSYRTQDQTTDSGLTYPLSTCI